MTTISNISITTDGTEPPADIEVTVTCDISNNEGDTPQAFFPAHAMGTDMTNSSGNTWTASDKQMYDDEKKLITIMCDDAEASATFTP
ncbi:MAG: hypothetical protein JKY27_03030 [Magnetovibrio sp.]|nr:hypothetical protein [Magnetovibrio sp.]